MFAVNMTKMAILLAIFLISACTGEQQNSSIDNVDNTNEMMFVSSAQVSVNENQINALTLKAERASSTVTYSLSAQDAFYFNVDKTTGIVLFKTAPNFETKNIYAFTATAIDLSGNVVNQNVLIKILDIDENVVNRENVQTINLAQAAQSKNQTIPAYLIDQFEKKRPVSFVQADSLIFSQYSSASTSTYSQGNWASQFDFSGVGWDRVQAGTLVTNQHIIVAYHYRRDIGSTIVFHAKDGTRVERTVVVSTFYPNMMLD
ncbi:MAG: cadherin repeat domain-containing protein [Pseudomonadota bacterium]